MAKDNIKFYEDFDWKTLKFADLEEKIKLILKMIPVSNYNTTCLNWGYKIDFPNKFSAMSVFYDSFITRVFLKIYFG